MKSSFAKETFPAGNGEGNDDAVTDLQRLVVPADFYDFAHGLVAHDVAAMHVGHDAIIEVEIRAADGAGRHFNDCVAAVLDFWIGDTLTANVVLSVPGECLHCRSSFRIEGWQVAPRPGLTGVLRRSSRQFGIDKREQARPSAVRLPIFHQQEVEP